MKSSNTDLRAEIEEILSDFEPVVNGEPGKYGTNQTITRILDLFEQYAGEQVDAFADEIEKQFAVGLSISSIIPPQISPVVSNLMKDAKHLALNPRTKEE